MVLAPESLAITLTGSKFVGHLPSSLLKFIGQNRSRPNREETSVQEMDAYGCRVNSLFLVLNFPVLQNAFPVSLCREFRQMWLQHSSFLLRMAGDAVTIAPSLQHEFPATGNFTGNFAISAELPSVSTFPFGRFGWSNSQKSPAQFANIPVLRRLWPET
jgi:hypothetical protein